MKTALFVGLGIAGLLYLVALGRAIARARGAGTRGEESATPSLLEIAIGFVTNFFDTLGIGSFAPTTAAFKLKSLVRDEWIPGTLNVGHSMPALLQALIFIATVSVDVVTLTLMIGAAVLGSWIGAGVVAGWPRRNIQIGMGCALIVAAALYVLTILGIAPGGGDARALTGVRLAIGLSGNLVLGMLMEVGVGLYGPCLLLISLLGMDPRAGFPIMMGSCAFLMPIGSLKFIASGRFSIRASLGLLIGGLPAVLIAALIVKSMPLEYLRVLVTVVVLYTAFAMLRSAAREPRSREQSLPAA